MTAEPVRRFLNVDIETAVINRRHVVLLDSFDIIKRCEVFFLSRFDVSDNVEQGSDILWVRKVPMPQARSLNRVLFGEELMHWMSHFGWEVNL
jgi:hypothetical protein